MHNVGPKFKEGASKKNLWSFSVFSVFFFVFFLNISN